MPHTLDDQVSLALMASVVACALAFGGWRERVGGAIVAGGTFGAIMSQHVTASLDPAPALFGIDLVVAAGLIVLTWRTRSGWPFVATACQGVALAVHLIRLLTRDMRPWTYLTALAVVSYGVMGALAYGVWRAHRDRRRTPKGFSSQLCT